MGYIYPFIRELLASSSLVQRVSPRSIGRVNIDIARTTETLHIVFSSLCRHARDHDASKL